MEELFDQAQLPVPADKGGLQAFGAHGAAAATDYSQRPPQRYQLFFAFEAVGPGFDKGDGRLRCPPGGLAH